MKQKVVFGPDMGASFMDKILGARMEAAGKQYQGIIDKEAADGWKYHSSHVHTKEGKFCFVVPANAAATYLVFTKE